MANMHASRLLVAAALGLAASAPAVAATPARSGSAGSAAAPAMVVPWIHDDYTRAVAEARARKVPLFVEAWAPW